MSLLRFIDDCMSDELRMVRTLLAIWIYGSACHSSREKCWSSKKPGFSSTVCALSWPHSTSMCSLLYVYNELCSVSISQAQRDDIFEL